MGSKAEIIQDNSGTVLFFVIPKDPRGIKVVEYGYKKIEDALLRLLVLADFYRTPVEQVLLNKWELPMSEIETMLLKGATKRKAISVKKLCERTLERVMV